jgi:hypothetical protein
MTLAQKRRHETRWLHAELPASVVIQLVIGVKKRVSNDA